MTIFFKRAILALFFLGVVPVQAAKRETGEKLTINTFEEFDQSVVRFDLSCNDKPVGFAEIMAVCKKKGEWQFSLLEIYSQYQNKGYSHYLIDHVKNYLETRSVKKTKIYAYSKPIIWDFVVSIILAGIGANVLTRLGIDMKKYRYLTLLFPVMNHRCKLSKLIKLYSSYGAIVTRDYGLFACMEVVHG